MLYAVGTAFVVLVLATERTMRIHKDAAVTDELTGLLNRRGVLLAAQDLIARQARRGEPVSALMFDLDHFKSINDQFGHAIGDQALHLFAVTASASTRATDIVGRFGGEEFVALLPGTIADAKLVAERIRKAFESAGVTVAGCDLNATVSIGAAAGQPGTDIVALLAAADAALYRAKANGRNRVEAKPDEEMPVLFATTRPVLPGDRAERQATLVRGAKRTEPMETSCARRYPAPGLMRGRVIGRSQMKPLIYRCGGRMGHVASVDSSPAQRRPAYAPDQRRAGRLCIGLHLRLVRRIRSRGDQIKA